MKKLLLLLTLLFNLHASELQWFTHYQEAVNVSKQQHKPMLIFMWREGCPSCQYMEDNVFTDSAVENYLAQNFILAKMNTAGNDAPAQFQVHVTPVFHFVNADESLIREMLAGGKTAPFFLKIMKDVKAKAH